MIKVDLSLVRELKYKALANKPPQTPEQKEALSFASKVFNLISDGKEMADFWAFYLLNSALDSEPELRNKITTIMISGLLDTVESEKRFVDKYRAHALEKGYSNMVAFCDRSKQWCLAAKEVLSLFSKEDQLFIQDMRNSLVHGWLGKKHREKFNVKYFDGEKIVQEEISKTDYNDMLKVPLIGIREGNMMYQKGLYDVLEEFTKRFLDKELDYWKILAILDSDDYMESALKLIYSDIDEKKAPGYLNLFADLNE